MWKQCQINCVDSELNFLFHCNKYILLSVDFMQKLNAICSTDSSEIEKLKYILTHDQLISKTGKFITNALNKKSVEPNDDPHQVYANQSYTLNEQENFIRSLRISNKPNDKLRTNLHLFYHFLIAIFHDVKQGDNYVFKKL